MSTPQAGPQQPLPLAPPPPPPSKMGRADPDLQHRIPPSLSARVKVAIFAASFAVKLIRAIKRFEPHIKNPERLVQYFAERHDDAADFEDGEQFFKSWSAQLRRSADPLCYGSSATAQRSAAPDLCPWSLATGPRIVETEGNVYGEQQLELDLFEPTYAANVDEGQTFVDPRQTLSNIEDIYPLVPDDALNNPYYRSPSGLFQQPPQVQAPSSNVWDCADPRYNQDRMLSCYLSYVSAADPGRVITLEEIQSEKKDAEQNASWITEPQAGQLYETTYFANGEYDHLLAAEAIIGQNASMRSEGNKITSNNASSEKVDKVYVCSLDECKEANPAFLRKSELKKHMDKHNRPYKCQHKECSSLPGFTYKGGLTRHETEVHGNARQFLCRHKHCNRATHGFAREDNLRDHEERMHKEDRKQKQRRRIDAGFGNPVGTDRIDKAARHPHPQSHSHSQPHLPPGSADYRHLLRMVERSASSAAQTKQMQLRLVQLESALQELRHANSVAT